MGGLLCGAAELRSFLPAYTPPRPAPLARLTGRERQVLELVAAGRDNQAIAVALHLSVRTVERHLSNCYTKLDLTGRTARAGAAALYAAQPGG